ncbi:MAG: acetylglutamate kinase [Endomicrobium sp.]|jgi:acetylglutamate kinase|nr:acetylglutamate kinase [Endomicrobium sp.]
MRSLIVVKFGGSVVNDLYTRKKFIKEISYVSKEQNIILVHGGGLEITNLLNTFSLKSQFVNGLRYTDKDTISIVEMALSGKVNRDLTTDLLQRGIKAVGMSGKDGNSVICRQIKKLGYVGMPKTCNKELIEILINNHFIPVIASIANNSSGCVLNVNADTLAAFLAISFQAKKLVYLTDVDGVVDQSGKIIQTLHTKRINKLINDKIIKKGMIPKVRSCVQSVKKGVEEVWIIGNKSGIRKLKGTVIKK